MQKAGVVAELPRLLLILLATPRLFVILQRPTCPVPKSAIYYLKIVLTLVLATLTAFDGACYWLMNSKSKGMSLNASDMDGFCRPMMRHHLLASSVGVAVYIFAAFLHHIEHFRCSIGSTALLFFWLFDIIASSVKLRTAWLSGNPLEWPHPLLDLSIKALVVALALIVFVLENLPKPKPYYSSLPSSVEDAEREEEGKCPELQANIFSRLSFHWMDPLMKLGAKKDLEMEDLWCLSPLNTSSYNSNLFFKYWDEEVAKKNPKLLWACIRAFGPLFFSAAILKAAQDICSFIQPTFLKLIMKFVGSWKDGKEGQPVSRGYAIAFLMLGTAFTQTLFLHQYFHICIVVGMRFRAAVSAAVYRKALRLSSSSRQSSTVGEIVNLMSVDAGRLGDLATYLHIIWSGPFQISMALYLLYSTLGPSIFAGVAVMIVMIPINAVLATRSRAYNKEQMKNKDTRTKLMDEVLNGIKVIKLYAWEIPFMKQVNGVRERELDTLKKIGMLAAVQSFTWACTPFLVSFFSFFVYSFVSNDPLTSEKVFVCLALFNLLQFPLAIFPSVITSVIEASVSFNRLYKFLMNEELDPEAVIRLESAKSGSDSDIVERVAISDATFRWMKDSSSPVLDNISLSVNDGSLVAIVGSVGSGKSSLISGILGEMYKTSGEVRVNGSIAYVSQTPWIMNATLRENILFGKRYDPKFYDDTIAACGLKPDIEILPGGDLTEIGEKGINLSGGQKQRISLARAVYARCNIYLLDDTLSAVDAHVGRHIFDNVIGPNGILRDRARIFVTHGLNFLPKTDAILLLLDGKMVESGSYESLMKLGNGGRLFNLIKDHGKRREASASTDGGEGEEEESAPGTPIVGSVNSGLLKKARSLDKLGKSESSHSLSAPPAPTANLIMKEESAKGSVSMSVYSSYAQACSFGNVVLYIVAAILSQFLSISQNLYLADWANANDNAQDKITAGLGGAENKQSETIQRLAIYGAIGLIYSGSVIFQTIFAWVYCGIRSARLLHNQMLENVLHLPQSYFDTTPLGRILNRFAKDMYTVDETLPRVFQGYFRTLFAVFSVLVVNTFGNPFFLIYVIPLSLVYMYFQRYYLFTSRELKRLDSTSKSPIYAHFQETLAGVGTIRAYGQQTRFISTNEDRVDFNLRAYYPSVSSNRWLAVRLESLGSLIVFGSAIFAVITIAIKAQISASFVGLAIVYSLNVTQTLNWMVRQSCEIETNIVSVERIKEYIELPKEAPYEIPENTPPATWPENGVINFENYSTRYRAGLDLVLNDITFSVNPREKIGVVGRTGAGKSSLTLALFRIVEPAAGSIRIDDVDIKVLGLFDLRSKMTIIPQDAFLFTGTIRDNLDPFGKALDADLWAALESASLKSVVERLDGKLDAKVNQGGENFSVGQRQLVCLARAVLRKSRILVLDEATAAIDYETDAAIQRTIRTLAKDSTIITIAHRINTIIDYDRILVLDGGKVVELDTPKNLLANKNSKFYALAKESGLTK
ncbi:hypothetical protein HDU67_006264 [Dinochytrium kinnereticum]|nr:hypothetical protein HDU67_006264 [Dinochytrium kinnereticum]